MTEPLVPWESRVGQRMSLSLPLRVGGGTVLAGLTWTLCPRQNKAPSQIPPFPRRLGRGTPKPCSTTLKQPNNRSQTSHDASR
jgi:hypothetical protein